jgi:hypothetical protein
MESPASIVTLAGPKLKLTMLIFTVFDAPAVVVVTGSVVVVATGCVVVITVAVVVGASVVVVVGVVVSSGGLSLRRTDVVVVSADPGVTVTTDVDVDVDCVEASASARVDVVTLSVALLQLAATSISSEPRTNRSLAESMVKR